MLNTDRSDQITFLPISTFKICAMILSPEPSNNEFEYHSAQHIRPTAEVPSTRSTLKTITPMIDFLVFWRIICS